MLAYILKFPSQQIEHSFGSNTSTFGWQENCKISKISPGLIGESYLLGLFRKSCCCAASEAAYFFHRKNLDSLD